MPAKKSTPAKRAADAKREVSRIQRRYKTNLKTKKKFLPGEEEHIADTVIVLKLAGYTGSQIGSVVGISRGQVREILAKPDVAERLFKIRESLPGAALELLQGYMIEAVQAIVDVMRRANDDKFILQAAGEILDRAGLPKASKQERQVVNEEKITVTDDGMLDKLRRLPPEQQEQAAQMIEQLEGLLKETAEIAAEDADAQEDQ